MHIGEARPGLIFVVESKDYLDHFYVQFARFYGDDVYSVLELKRD